MFKNKAFVLY